MLFLTNIWRYHDERGSKAILELDNWIKEVCLALSRGLSYQFGSMFVKSIHPSHLNRDFLCFHCN